MSEKKMKDIMNEMYEKVTVNGSHGIYIGDAEHVKQLESRLKEAEKVIDDIYEASKSNAVTKFGVEEITRGYIEKYNIPKGV